MGRWHTEILSNVPEIEIGGIYDIKEEKRIEAKEKVFCVWLGRGNVIRPGY